MRKTFALSDYVTTGTSVQLAVAAVFRASLVGLVVVEAAAIATEGLPSHIRPEVFERARSILLPANGTGRVHLTITPAFLVGSALSLAGGLLRVSCYRALGRFFKWQSAVEEDHELVTTGPYAVVRHPSYTALLFLTIGAPLALLTPGSYAHETGMLATSWGKAAAAVVFGWLGTVACALMLRIGEEEEELRKKFGAEWQAWAARTPYKLIPGVY
ncbi:hypothetical protein BD414DRAFT_475636 [Trametes punicea]|nr:hypothetical protein BD414DRAFT_475636 [Trametes punicea]